MSTTPWWPRGLAAAILVACLAGCAPPPGQLAPSAVRAGSRSLIAGEAAAEAAGSVDVAVELASPVRGLLATTPVWAALVLELRPVGAVGARRSLRRRITPPAAGPVSVACGPVAPGAWLLRLEALDASQAVLAVVEQAVRVAPRQARRVAVRLELGPSLGRVTPPPGLSASPPAPGAAPASLEPALQPGPVPAPGGATASPSPAVFPEAAPVASPTPAPVVPVPVASPTPAPVGPAPVASPSPAPAPTPDLAERLAEGERLDLIGAAQARALAAHLPTMPPDRRGALEGLVTAAGSDLERIFILKAASVGNTPEALAEYAAAIRQQPATWVMAVSTMRDERDLVQQWEDACGPAMDQTAVGELDPRYAWQLDRAYQVARVDEAGVNRGLAQQQRDWLEAYGGVAVPRGASGGLGIGVTRLLNDVLSPISRARYAAVEVSEPGRALAEVAVALRAGHDVPLRLVWDAAGTRAHFLLALAAAGEPGALRVLLHDTFTGTTAWVDEAQFRADRLQPIHGAGQHARLTHWYRPTPMEP